MLPLTWGIRAVKIIDVEHRLVAARAWGEKEMRSSVSWRQSVSWERWKNAGDGCGDYCTTM